MKVAVVGAGVAGLSAASALHDAGHEVTVHEAAGSVGGRLASVRAHGTVADVGAQYVTVRDDGFRDALRGLLEAEALVPWADELPYWESGVVHPPRGPSESRYVSPEGMDVVARWLARTLDVRLRSRVSDVRVLGADAVVVAVPAPLAEELVGRVPAVAMTPCLAWVAGYGDAPPPAWNGLFVNGHPLVEWVAVDSSKRRGPETVLVSHLVDGVRPLRGQLEAALGELVAPWASRPRWVVSRWWEHARVRQPLSDGALRADGVVVAGDWCAGSRVEGAFVSGRAAAASLLS